MVLQMELHLVQRILQLILLLLQMPMDAYTDQVDVTVNPVTTSTVSSMDVL